MKGLGGVRLINTIHGEAVGGVVWYGPRATRIRNSNVNTYITVVNE